MESAIYADISILCVCNG